MIIITGAGRCGTSLLAQTYATAGEDPGGSWHADINAGFEDPDAVRLNRRILRAMDASLLGHQYPLELTGPIGGPVTMHAKRVLPPRLKYRMRRVNNRLPWNRPRKLKMLNWSRIDQVVDQFQDEMVQLSRRRTLVKDPQFTLTLELWLRAGASIDHVIALSRSVDDMIASRSRAEMFGYRSESLAKNALLLAGGTLAATLADNPALPRTTLRFPQFATSPEGTAAALPETPRATRADLERALLQLVDVTKIREGSAARCGS